MKLSLVVPCFNEEEVVYDFYKEVNNVFSGKISDYEFVFVNDGSSDNTPEILKAIYGVSSNVQVIGFSRNFGKEAAVLAGLKNARGDYVCIIDADLQQRPEVVLEMLDILDENENVDAVAAYQEERKEGKLLTFFKNSFYSVINKMSEVDFYTGASDFRLMRRTVVEAIINMTEYHRFSKGLFSFVGFNTQYIPYEVCERAGGKTKWSFVKLLNYAVEGIVGFSTKPLRFATFFGLGAVAVSLLYLIIALVAGAVTGNITASIPVITLILFMGGINSLFIGITGEYLARTYIQGKNRPVYIVKELLSHKDDEEVRTDEK